MTHLWPETDTFDAGSPNYDDGFLTQYTRAKIVTTDPAYLSGGSGFGLSTFFSSTHVLYDGWGGAANAEPGNPTGTSGIGAWLWRVATVADCEASIGYAMVADSALIDSSPRRFHMGVGCRISGGTLTSGGTTSAYHNAPSGYYGSLLYDTGTNGRFVIFRVDAGTIVRLAEAPVPPSFRTWASIAPRTPRTLRLVCTTNGFGNVDLELWSNATRGGAVSLITSAVDSSVSKITTSGRAGFFASIEKRDTGINAAPVLSFFTAGAANGAPDFRDEFERLDRLAALDVSGAMKAGRVLTSSFYRDLWGASGTNGVLIANIAASRVAVSTSAAAKDLYFLSQRPASDPLAQSREATIRFAGGGSFPNPSHRKIGIVVRAQLKGHTGGITKGYVAVAHYEDNTATGWIRLLRASDESTLEEIGVASGVAFAVNTEYLLRIDVENDAIPSPLTGNVKIKVYLGGVQVALVDQGVKNTTINGVGTVTDASKFRIQSGYGEGLYFVGPNASTRNVACSLWNVGSVLAPVEVPDEDHETILLAGEDDGATGTFTFPLSYPIDETIALERPITQEFEADYDFHGSKSDSIRTTWRASIRVASESDRDDIAEFIDEHRGSETPFTYTPPGRTSAILCRFGAETSSHASPTPDFFVFDPVVIEEVHA